jgi:hypothetical protein
VEPILTRHLFLEKVAPVSLRLVNNSSCLYLPLPDPNQHAIHARIIRALVI